MCQHKFQNTLYSLQSGLFLFIGVCLGIIGPLRTDGKEGKEAPCGACWLVAVFTWDVADCDVERPDVLVTRKVGLESLIRAEDQWDDEVSLFIRVA